MEFELLDSSPTKKPQGCPGLTHMGMGCFQPNQGCVVYADEWAQVHRSFALVLLSPGFPGPAVPSPALGGPSNALCSTE